MLSKCANPGCTTTFLYLHRGKLFRLDAYTGVLAHIPAGEATKPAWRVEFFWLCNQCATEMTLGYNKENGITVVPLSEELARAASTS